MALPGPAGKSASTAFEFVDSIGTNQWYEVGISDTPGAHIDGKIISPYLSYDSVGTGAVLVYIQSTTTTAGVYTWQELPYTNYNTYGTAFTNQFNWFDGGINIDIYNSLYTFTNPLNTFIYSVVVIPGTKSLPAGIDIHDYNSVVAYYKPRMVH